MDACRSKGVGRIFQQDCCSLISIKPVPGYNRILGTHIYCCFLQVHNEMIVLAEMIVEGWMR